MRSAEQPYGVRSVERGTASLRIATFTRIYLSAECGARSAERLCFVYYANKDIIKNFLTDKNALVWMRYEQKEIPPTGVYFA